MSEFKRGIENQKFIEELNSNTDFQRMIADKDLFIAIRDEYLNVYYYGQSISKISFAGNKIKWRTHKKYLGINESGYADTSSHLDDLENIKAIIAREYAGREKKQVNAQILKNEKLCILDVEVTFGREENSGKLSIDYLAVEKNENDKITLVFYEAKHFDNSEIRARDEPKVFNQIKKYGMALNTHKIEIINSYKTICKNVFELNLNNRDKLHKLIGADIGQIEIDVEPRLIIFEIDQSKIKDTHIQKLEQKYRQPRLILIERK
ncbi:hypothetical protein [Daejeonella sp.]|uniref:hypothetical protein n=1 Tax=Daejeonella sp. TaxID=2805397 RepID=UPI0030C4A5F7